MVIEYSLPSISLIYIYVIRNETFLISCIFCKRRSSYFPAKKNPARNRRVWDKNCDQFSNFKLLDI